MQYRRIYRTPDGFSDLVMESDGIYLTDLSFFESFETELREEELSVFEECKEWLDIYFGGEEPCFMPKYKLCGCTEFRMEVLDILISVPYGETVTYGDIAAEIAKKRNIKRMSAQAVGGAVGRNPLSIIIPCHRVIGSDGSLIGYTGGIENKRRLLRLEQGV